ncbi:hypothetical protein ACH5RR_015629 [Cinchona calisaya]|uniref:Uncharacterized protein n=1 Tax=Cinchona calisaya TaxID=153742 RepID=A0ABD2ZX40_9GENT
MFMGSEERFEWANIMEEYLKRWGLGDAIELRLSNPLPKEIMKRKTKLFFKIMRKSMVIKFFKRVVVNTQSPEFFWSDLFYILMEFTDDDCDCKSKFELK